MSTIFNLAARLQAGGVAEEFLLIVVKATLILAIARLLLFAMPRASAAAKHAVATATLVAVALMPLASVLVPAWELAFRSPASQQKQVGASDAEEEQTSTLGTAISLARVTGVVPEAPLTAVERANNIGRVTWKGLIVLAFAGAASLFILHMLLGLLGVWHVARHATPLDHEEALRELDAARAELGLGAGVRLLRSPRISVPVLWGVFRPVLLLPSDVVTWPAERLRVVLLHELAHLKRYDGVSLIATRLAVSLFWFHPLAWSLERAGRSECERACDDLVLAGGTKPSAYADHLLAIARSMPAFDPFRSVTLAMSRKSQLEGRLLSILQPGVARRVFSGRAIAVACSLAVVAILPLAAVRMVAQQSPAEPPRAQKAGSTITVTPDVEKLENFFLAKLGPKADRLARTPENGEEWYERAFDLYRSDRYQEAAAAFHHAAAAGYKPDFSLYNAACSHALLGDAERATATLVAAIDAGWDDLEKIADDSDFDPIRDHPRFIAAMAGRDRQIVTRRIEETRQKYEQLRGGNASQAGWHEVGFDLMRLRRFDEALHAFEQAIAAGDKPATAMYNIACLHSLRGDADRGMAALEAAIANGFSGERKLRHDPELALLRKQPRFETLLERSEDLELRGCCNDHWTQWLTRSWTPAVEHHRRMAQKHPEQGRAWFNLGYVALQARDFDTAHNALRATLARGYRTGTTSYNIACAYALQGDRDAAFEWLARAQAAGFDVREHGGDDSDLDSLRKDARWKKLVSRG